MISVAVLAQAPKVLAPVNWDIYIARTFTRRLLAFDLPVCGREEVMLLEEMSAKAFAGGSNHLAVETRGVPSERISPILRLLRIFLFIVFEIFLGHHRSVRVSHYIYIFEIGLDILCCLIRNY